MSQRRPSVPKTLSSRVRKVSNTFRDYLATKPEPPKAPTISKDDIGLPEFIPPPTSSDFNVLYEKDFARQAAASKQKKLQKRRCPPAAQQQLLTARDEAKLFGAPLKRSSSLPSGALSAWTPSKLRERHTRGDSSRKSHEERPTLDLRRVDSEHDAVALVNSHPKLAPVVPKTPVQTETVLPSLSSIPPPSDRSAIPPSRSTPGLQTSSRQLRDAPVSSQAVRDPPPPFVFPPRARADPPTARKSRPERPENATAARVPDKDPMRAAGKTVAAPQLSGLGVMLQTRERAATPPPSMGPLPPMFTPRSRAATPRPSSPLREVTVTPPRAASPRPPPRTPREAALVHQPSSLSRTTTPSSHSLRSKASSTRPTALPLGKRMPVDVPFDIASEASTSPRSSLSFPASAPPALPTLEEARKAEHARLREIAEGSAGLRRGGSLRVPKASELRAKENVGEGGAHLGRSRSLRYEKKGCRVTEEVLTMADLQKGDMRMTAVFMEVKEGMGRSIGDLDLDASPLPGATGTRPLVIRKKSKGGR